MALDFLTALQEVYRLLQHGKVTEHIFHHPCKNTVESQQYYVYLMIPAVLVTIFLSFTEKRVLKRNFCRGRLVLLHPHDALGRSSRVSYAAAFGSLACLCVGVMFYGNHAIPYTGPIHFKVFIALLSMIIYGVGYFPLFAAISLNSIPGYIVGITFAWTLTVISFIRTFQCENLSELHIRLLIVRGLPEFICQTYLCVSLPIQLVLHIRGRKSPASKNVQIEARTSFSGIKVRKLLKKRKQQKAEPSTLAEKIMSLVLSIPARLLYHNLPEFRYSGRVLSVFTVAFIIIYMITFEVAVNSISIFRVAELYLTIPMTAVGLLDQEGESEVSQSVRFALGLGMHIVRAVQASFLTSVFAAFCIGCVLILHSLSAYRYFLLKLYKGKNVHLIPKGDISNVNMLVGFMRYAGYQVAYIAWGYCVQALVLFLVAMFITTVVLLITFGLGDWLIDRLNAVWPFLLTTLLVNLIQVLMAKFVFLQRRGNVLALNNRRLFFIVVYFMFFYNIFLGLASCLFRIGKAILVGVLFLPRLDHCTLPRRFQWFDPGFDAYCGFMHVESAHTNPVAITFIKLLQIEILTTTELPKHLGMRKNSKPHHTFVILEEKGHTRDVSARRKSRRTRLRWHLTYTLLRNPSLLENRKHHISDSFNNSREKNIDIENEDI